MNKDKKLIPELRFPEFLNEGEWIFEPFDKVYSFFVTNSFSRENLNYNNGSVKNIHYGDIHTKFTTLFDITKEVVPFINSDISIERIREECYCIEGDLIFADASEDLNDVGKSIEIINLNSEKLLSGLHTLLARQKESKLTIGFAGYLFKTDWIRKQIQREAQGAKVLGISATRISNIKISYPKNSQEQQKIASCLSSLDEVIAAHSQKLELLKDHKKGLMQNLFPQMSELGLSRLKDDRINDDNKEILKSSNPKNHNSDNVPKFRFPEFEKDGEWVEKKLEYLTIKIGDGIHSTPKYDTSGEYYFINGNNLIEGKIVVDEKTKRVSIEEFEIHKKDLTEKTIFLSINGTIGNIAFYNNEMVVLGKSACYITPSQKLDNVFLYYSLQSPRIIDYFFSELTGSTIKNLSLKSIRETIINLPSEKEQQKIAYCLSSLDALITKQAEKIEQLKLHKKGLMQGLFPKMSEL